MRTLTLQELRNSERLLAKAENSRQSASVEEQEASKALTDAEQRRKASWLHGGGRRKTAPLDEEAMAVHNELDSLTHRHEACIQRKAELAEQQAADEKEAGQLKERQTSWEDKEKELQQQKAQKETELAAAQKAWP